MAEIIGFPNDRTQWYIEQEIIRVLSEATVSLAELEYVSALALSHSETHDTLNVHNLAKRALLEMRATKQECPADEFPHMWRVLQIVAQDHHPSLRDVRQAAAVFLNNQTSDIRNSVVDTIEINRAALADILNEICTRELPCLDGETEFPETTFHRLVDELPPDEFKRIFFAYCDTYGVNYDNLLQ